MRHAADLILPVPLFVNQFAVFDGDDAVRDILKSAVMTDNRDSTPVMAGDRSSQSAKNVMMSNDALIKSLGAYPNRHRYQGTATCNRFDRGDSLPALSTAVTS